MRFAVMLASLLFIMPSAQAETIDSIAAVVNNEAVTCYDVEQDAKGILMQLRQSGSAKLPSSSELSSRALKGRIIKALQLQEARRLELTVSDEELSKTIDGIETKNGLLPGQLEEIVKQQGLDFNEYKKNMRDQLMISKLINIAVRSKLQISDDALHEYYDKYIANPEPRREVQLAQIFLALPNEPTPEQLTEIRNKAIKLRARVVAGGNFARLAALHSDAPDSQQGGIMGWFKPGGISQRFASVVELPTGKVSELIRSPAGFHMIKVLAERWKKPDSQGESHDEVHARHILLQIPKSADQATRSKINKRAQEIASEMQEADDEAFATRAREASQGPSASRGGDLGWFKHGMMVAAFEDVAFRLKPGETSGVVKSPFGLHIIRVIGKRHIDPNSFEANRENIVQILSKAEMQERLPRWLAELTAKANIERRKCSDIEVKAPAAIRPAQPAPVAESDTLPPAAALDHWARAWSNKNLPAYFSAYSRHFDPGRRFASIARWKAYKKRVILNKRFIRVTVKDLTSSPIDDTHVRLKFDQFYESGRLNEHDRKEIIMEKTADGWKIISERIIS